MENLVLKKVGKWHGFFKFQDFVRIEEILTGCGINIIYGVRFLNEQNRDSFLECLKTIADEEKLHDSFSGFSKSTLRPCGTFICTLGSMYYGHEKNLLHIGFKQVMEYPNKAHYANGDFQKLYILTL